MKKAWLHGDTADDGDLELQIHQPQISSWAICNYAVLHSSSTVKSPVRKANCFFREGGRDDLYP
ncbi:hypothetical protein QQP08_002196 [Theobroma cacao]|nr:hypothetical protein QQP08_002196 [Theobroma cacao]